MTDSSAREPFKRLQTRKDFETLLASYDAILLDCDGVIWESNRLYPHVKDALFLLHARQVPHYFVTNNATASRKHYREKFVALGLDYVQEVKECYASVCFSS